MITTSQRTLKDSRRRLNATTFVALLVAIVPLSICRYSLAAETAQRSPIGMQVADFSLDNCYGKQVSLSDFREKKAIALIFLGTECPLAKLYGPRLAKIQSAYGDKGVQIIGVNSNTQDSLTELAAYVHRHEINFPMLKDRGNRIADALDAKRTPEVFLLDQSRVVRYHGRIDDQYGVGYSKERQARPELTLAIDQLLAGDPISKPLTEAVGCHIGRVKKVEPHGEITFTKHIAPILNEHCVRCHREGEIAPFTLTSYEDVQGWEDTILEVIDDQRMPPWSANPAHGTFSNDPRLSPQEYDLIYSWIENGMPRGDDKDLPEPPQFIPGWQIAKPDQIIHMRKSKRPFNVPAEGIVDYQRWVVDPGWDEDKYIIASEARPDCRQVVHHILAYVIPPGGDKADLRQIVAGYAPGVPPMDLTDGVALHVEAGSRLLFEMHYTPNGSPQKDLSYIGLRFTTKDKVKRRLQGRVAINQDFLIRAGRANESVTAEYKVKSDEDLLSMTPHMHLRGKAFRYEAIFPNGTKQVLLDVPRYDFNWQLKYILDQPLRLPRKTTIRCTALFDNSDANLTNPDPTQDVRWGDQSFNEMMIGFMETVPAR